MFRTPSSIIPGRNKIIKENYITTYDNMDTIMITLNPKGSKAVRVYMNKGPERVRVWRLWHWFSSPGRVRRTRPGGLNQWQCHNLHTMTRLGLALNERPLSCIFSHDKYKNYRYILAVKLN